MGKIICNAISGLCNGQGSNEATLRKFLKGVFGTKVSRIRCVPSVPSSCLESSVDFINSYSQRGVNFLLVGKSFGAVRTWWLLQDYWHKIEKILNDGHRIGVVLIDPHGWVIGDDKAVSYGVNEKELPWHEDWGRDEIRFRCLYQRNRYPRGAYLGAPDDMEGINVLLDDDADHYNMLDLKTDTGAIVAKNVKDILRWLGEETCKPKKG